MPKNVLFNFKTQRTVRPIHATSSTVVDHIVLVNMYTQ